MSTHTITSEKPAETVTGAPRLTISLAAFVVICFFLPWLQVSCLGLKDAASGFGLARRDDPKLWLVLAAMLLVLLTGLGWFIWKSAPMLFGIVGIVGGGLSAYLMYREHSRIAPGGGLIATQWTIWFWMGLIASLGVVASAFGYYIRRARAP